MCKEKNEEIDISRMLPSKSEELINLAPRGRGLIFTKRTLGFLNATYCQSVLKFFVPQIHEFLILNLR